MNNSNANISQEDGARSSNEIKASDRTIPAPLTVEKLTEKERADFKKHEKTIETGVKAYWEIGDALTDINARRLFKENYPNIDAYCIERWGFKKSHGYRYMDASATLAHLSPIGETPKLLPACEAQIRPLVGLKPDQARSAWNNAIKAAGEKPVTAKLVEAEAAKLKEPKHSKAQAKKTPAKEKAEPLQNDNRGDKTSPQEEAYRKMDDGLLDLKKVRKLNDSQKEDWTGLLDDIVATLKKLGVTDSA